MSPAFMLMRTAQRVPLVEEMIVTVEMNEAVGIVKQPGNRCQMPAGIVAVAERLWHTLHHRLQNGGKTC